MKLYRVTAVDRQGRIQAQRLFDKYTSVIASKGNWTRRDFAVTVEVVRIPDSAWKPVRREVERDVYRLEALAWRLAHDDRDAFAEAMDKAAEAPALQDYYRTLKVELLPRERDEAAALLQLNRLVDAD